MLLNPMRIVLLISCSVLLVQRCFLSVLEVAFGYMCDERKEEFRVF